MIDFADAFRDFTRKRDAARESVLRAIIAAGFHVDRFEVNTLDDTEVLRGAYGRELARFTKEIDGYVIRYRCNIAPDVAEAIDLNEGNTTKC